MELWQECSVWLNRFKVLPPAVASLLLAQHSPAEQFVACLKDGVILCQLAHSLDPGSLDMTRVICAPPGRGVSDYICQHNMFLFLHAAVSSFQLNMDEYFFQPDLFYQAKDIGKVLRTLSAFSHCPKVRKSGIPGFPKKEKKLVKKIHQEEKIYASLKETYKESGGGDIYDSFSQVNTSVLEGLSMSTSDSSSIYGVRSDKIYETIISPKSRVAIKIPWKSNKRDQPIKELVDTEDKYLENLIMVRDTFREKLTSISVADKSVIFYKLDELITLHTDMLMGFKMKPASIGRVILNVLSGLGMLYGEYCVNLPMAIERVTAVQESTDKVRKQLLDCQQKATPSTFSLSSHLVLPFQRFLKYHLILQQIVKHTAADHPESGDLSLAVQGMLRVGAEVNDKKRMYEENEAASAADEADLQLIANVEQQIKLMQFATQFQSLSDFGRLRKTGDLTCQLHLQPTGGKQLTDYAFLFDTVLLLCQKPKLFQARYRFKTAIKLKEHTLDASSSAVDPLSLRLYRHNLEAYPLLLESRSPADRAAWFEAILSAKDMADPNENHIHQHVLQMTTFPLNKECWQCHKVLMGKFFQGYRCARCQACLHKRCIGDYACLDSGTLKRMASRTSMTLPTALPDTLERSKSSLSLAPPADNKRQSATQQQLDEIKEKEQRVRLEMENRPLEEQPYYAGDLPPKTATMRLRNLDVGTFLVRRRAKGGFALALQSNKGGVKHMEIHVENHDDGTTEVSFSEANKFVSLQKMIAYYANKELTENFDYPDLRGVCLRMPFKNV